ncbi:MULTISPECIES: YbfB/YjiJ family MFS transporter [unclassified Roseibium]|uniref:YbfB/YjiJ family MFS transporter n=1 Tax=unclassified Roseibium TaxID=2629323 RepID=UPI00273F8152|nr:MULTISPECIES: YbfB/YjiJ family MFS transporter [unclassified Roseibium]
MKQSFWSSVCLALGGLLALAAAMGIGRFVYTPILPSMAEGIPLTPSAAGLIASANFLGYLTGALIGASRFLGGTPRTWFLAGLALSALTSAAMALNSDVWFFMMIRFISGLASAFVLVFSTTLILERLTTAGHSALSAVHFSGVGIGIALSAVLIAALNHNAADWQTLWLASGLATAILLVGAIVLVPTRSNTSPTAPADGNRAPEDGRRTWSPTVIRLVAAYGLFGFGYVITATFVSVMARTTPSLTNIEPYVWLVVGLSAAPSIYVWNLIAAKLGARRAFALACLVEAGGVAMTAVSTSPTIFLTGAALLGGTFMGITALGLAEGRRLTAEAGTAAVRQMLATLTASFGLGQAAGPWIAGQLHGVTGSFQAPSIAAAIALVIAAALAGL